MQAKWLKPLTKRQIAHIAKYSPTKRPALWLFKHFIQHQRDTGLICWECEEIARRIGLDKQQCA